MSLNLQLNWNLEEIFSLNHESDFSKHLTFIQQTLIRLQQALDEGDADNILAQWQLISSSLRHGFSYTACLAVEEEPHPLLIQFQTSLVELEKTYSILCLKIEMFWAAMQEKLFNQWIGKKEHASYAHLIRHRREQILKRMDLKLEILALSLSLESYVPLGGLYEAISHKLAVHIPDQEPIDIIQAKLLMKEKDPVSREVIFENFEECYKKQASIFCTLINQVYGYRCELFKARSYLNPLSESFEQQRIRATSIESMWRMVNDKKACLILFLNKKASLFHHKKPTWCDVGAELIQKNRTPLTIMEASTWVQVALSRLHPEVSQFAKTLLQEGGVSSRGLSKIGISSCTLPLPLARKVRIFLGYQDGIERLLDYTRQMATAWRYHLLFDQPEVLQQCPMIISEAINSFCERLALEVVKERAFTRQQQFEALYSHMQRATITIIDMQTRFLFEQNLFKEKMSGWVSESKLCEMMLECQQEAYAHQLGRYFPYYWASKESFYTTTSAPFQNYASTAGFLLGLGLYQKYRLNPGGFYDKIKSWIRLSAASCSVEKSTVEAFDVHLEQDKIWSDAIALLEEDVRVLANLMEIKDKTFSLEMRGY